MTRRLLVVVADGVRPDILAEEIDAGHTPELARMRDRGGLHVVSTSFPSVTGPAYAPFTMGRHPSHVGMPGLRWFDRARSLRWAVAPARSYVGMDIWRTDEDLASHAPTLYEMVQPSLAGMMMIGRGATLGRVGRGIGWMIRASPAHFRGDILGWRTVERAAASSFLKRFAQRRPRLSMLALASPDKFSHAYGSDSPPVRDAIHDVDATIARAREIANTGGWGDTLNIWVVSDHGHAPVAQHDDIHGWLTDSGHRVLAHPKLHTRNADIALMVGGNAMAHLYLEPSMRTRTWWPTLASRWQPVLDGLLVRPSTDLVAVAINSETTRVHHAERGDAELTRVGVGDGARWHYVTMSGDPLQLGGSHRDLDAHDAWELAHASPYPDSLVQLGTLVPSGRAGDIIVSAAANWDLRSRYEPVTHISTHGALLKQQMHVPLLLDMPVARSPQRTTDVVPSALELLGVDATQYQGVPIAFDGRSFL